MMVLQGGLWKKWHQSATFKTL